MTASTSIELPTPFGRFNATYIRDGLATHLLLRLGEVTTAAPVLVRIHSSCCFGDVFGGLSCDCRAQLELAIRAIAAEGSGLFFYLNQEGRGLGLAAKIEAIHLEQKNNIDTVEAFSQLRYPLDPRNYRAVSRVLTQMKIRSVRLLTNNPLKCRALTADGIRVSREPLTSAPTPHSIEYLKAKVQKMGHLWPPTLELQGSEESKISPQSKN